TVSGVVDAGGAGLCVVLDALSTAISGNRQGGDAVPTWAATPRTAVPAPAASSYEITYLIDADENALGELADNLDRIGDSLVVSGGGRQWHVHVHAENAGAAVEAGLAVGRLSKITITFLNAPPSATQDPPSLSSPRTAMVADGAGLIALLSGLGAVVV